jgi:selenocysteine lyase/cysteine desulfurase
LTGRASRSAPGTTAVSPCWPGSASPPTNRASFYLYMIPEEIDRLVEGLHKVKKTLGNGASPTRGPQ